MRLDYAVDGVTSSTQRPDIEIRLVISVSSRKGIPLVDYMEADVLHRLTNEAIRELADSARRGRVIRRDGRRFLGRCVLSRR